MEKLSESRRALALFIFLFSSSLLSAETIKIKAHGTASSSEILTGTEVTFDQSADLSTLRLVDGRGETIPHYFRPEPEPGHIGTLYWMWREVPMFHTEDYVLHYDPGEWSTEPIGDAAIGDAALQQKVMLPNGSFEVVEDGMPVGWKLENAAISDAYAYSGKNSIKIDAIKERDSPSFIAPSAGRIQGIEGGKRYNLSFRLLIPKAEDGSLPQATKTGSIRGDATFYDANGQRTNRNLNHYRVMLEDSIAQRGEWVLVSRATLSDEDAVEAHVRIATYGFDDTIYVDQIVLEELSKDEPFKFDVAP